MNLLNTPESVVELINTDFFLPMHRAIRMKAFILSYSRYSISDEASVENARISVDAFEEASGIRLTTNTFNSILRLYPMSESVIYDDPGATDAREEVLNMMAHFYLNSWWPGNGDKLHQQADGFEKFLEALKKAHDFMIDIT